ncbi:erythromycin resistance leader peptide [Cytobacillus sp. FJAT-53684]|uniref:Erythromycin resistance leader peptide n=1 Tax=Cytobacillus mangrovibacter TaxID=3299024 RepID=A0ABW6K377_9BACI
MTHSMRLRFPTLNS